MTYSSAGLFRICQVPSVSCKTLVSVGYDKLLFHERSAFSDSVKVTRVRVSWIKGKDKTRPGTGHEGPEGEYRYNSTLSLTSALDGRLASWIFLYLDVWLSMNWARKTSVRSIHLRNVTVKVTYLDLPPVRLNFTRSRIHCYINMPQHGTGLKSTRQQNGSRHSHISALTWADCEERISILTTKKHRACISEMDSMSRTRVLGSRG